jgi:DNA-binding SARP family transcriptional activator
VTDYDFRLLGPLTVLADGVAVPVRGARQQIVLTVLLLEANRIVPVGRLAEAVWGVDSPSTARNQIQMAVSELRRTFTKASGSKLIASHSAGYAIEVAEQSVDVLRFERLVAKAREAVRRGDIAAGADELRGALRLWSGEVGSGLSSIVVESAAIRLNEQRLSVLEECLDLELQLGRHHDLIGELRGLVAAYPLREGLHASLMLALYRAGRQAEALEASRRARQVLADEHGLDPGKRLADLEQAILTSDQSLSPPEPGAVATLPARPVPHQLPAGVPDFVGRQSVVADISERLTRGADRNAPGIEVVVVSGAGGIGKTTLAVHTGHQVRTAFPDGQLFARLRGVDAQPVRPKRILEEFLRALGASPAALPDSVEELSAEFRSRLSGNQMLIVLDDAASAEQVLPMMPGESGCAVLVTTRRSLAGLPGVHRIDLDVLDDDASLNLLSRVIGEERVRAEPEAASGLAEVCSGLPLALRIAAAKLSVRRQWSIGRMLARLNDERRLLDELDLEGVGVRASIAISYEALSERARRLLLQLGTLGATSFADWVAAPLLDEDPDDAADALNELDEASLVTVDTSGGGAARYRLHDLVRIFAQETLAREVPLTQRVEARVRYLRGLLFMARKAHERAHGGDFATLHPEVELWPLPEVVFDEHLGDPIDWFVLEHSNLVSAVELAAQLGHADLCWDLAMTSVTLFEARAYTDSWARTVKIAMDACRDAGDERGEAAMRYAMGGLALYQTRLSDAEGEYAEAVEYFDAVGDAHGRGLVQRNLGYVDRFQGQHDQALDRYVGALSDLRTSGDRFAEAHVLSGMAQVYLGTGKLDEAGRVLRQALQISVETGSARSQAQVRNALGHLYLSHGQLAEAESEFRAVLSAVAKFGDPVGMTYAHLGMALVNLAREEWVSADRALRDARAIADNTGDILSLGRVMLAQAETAWQADDHDSMATILKEARDVLRAAEAARWLEQVAALEQRLEETRRTTG